jgi:hypothetical protein
VITTVPNTLQSMVRTGSEVSGVKNGCSGRSVETCWLTEVLTHNVERGTNKNAVVRRRDWNDSEEKYSFNGRVAVVDIMYWFAAQTRYERDDV